eukprot:3670300-Rhodomonas_salina.1
MSSSTASPPLPSPVPVAVPRPRIATSLCAEGGCHATAPPAACTSTWATYPLQAVPARESMNTGSTSAAKARASNKVL